MGQLDDARATYTEATKTCKDSIPLWLLLADLEVRFPMQPSFIEFKSCICSLFTGHRWKCDESKERGGKGEAEEPWQ